MKHVSPRLCAAVLAFCALSPCRAQDPQACQIKGTIRSDQEVLLQGYVVELTDMATHREARRADVNSDGTFEIRDVPKGDYQLHVARYQGAPVKDEFVSVREGFTYVEIRLPQKVNPKPGGVVSLRELQHPPARKAVEAAAAAQRFARAGDYRKAAEQLQKAVAVSPEYAVAHSNLAVQYIRLRQYADARRELEQALQIAGPNALDLSNLAFLDATEHRYTEAIETARAALRADPGFANAHYILGTLLLLDRSTAPEGIRHLEQAAGSVPGARLVLERARGRTAAP